MSIIDSEIDEIKRNCENVVPNSKIIACTPVLIRIDIKQTQTRQITACLRFPENYPHQTILVEAKSKTLSYKFLDGLANLAEQKCKDVLGRGQVIYALQFIDQYLRENPLCVAFDEILKLKKGIGENANEQLRLKQKSSSVLLHAKGGCYYYKVKAVIPEEYPEQSIVLEDPETNLPPVLLRYLNGQSKEIARQCVEPPLRLAKDKSSQPFQARPSLYASLKFCIDATKDFYEEKCPICADVVLPKTYDELIHEDIHDSCVERVYCGHLYHQGCLKKFMNEPPFPKGGKLCPAKKLHARSDTRYNSNKPANDPDMRSTTCGLRIAHDRWVLNIKLAESRWAQKQARERELQEVVDFLQ